MNIWDDSKSVEQNLGYEGKSKQTSKLLVKGDEVILSRDGDRGNQSAMIITPGKGFHVQTMDCRLSELPPGTITNVHRHRSEAIIHFLQGRGYSMINDLKVDWKGGDTLFIPSWVWHNFCNTDAEQPVRYLAITNRPLIYGLGVEDEERKNGDLQKG